MLSLPVRNVMRGHACGLWAPACAGTTAATALKLAVGSVPHIDASHLLYLAHADTDSSRSAATFARAHFEWRQRDATWRRIP
jgi:hypothetical protein